jgi:hypothetical protein
MAAPRSIRGCNQLACVFCGFLCLIASIIGFAKQIPKWEWFLFCGLLYINPVDGRKRFNLLCKVIRALGTVLGK